MRFITLTLTLWTVVGLLQAGEPVKTISPLAKPADGKPYSPKISPASGEGVAAIKRVKVPEGMEMRLWAAEPLLANPVAFTFDNKGRCFVAETYRLHAGVTDIRNHMDWLDADLACRTVADRDRMYQDKLKEKADESGVHHDRVKLVVDSDGDGIADKAEVFADGFKNRVDGIGSGVLARNGKVFYTCIPDLWQLDDTGGLAPATGRRKLSSGYGVQVGFLGNCSPVTTTPMVVIRHGGCIWWKGAILGGVLVGNFWKSRWRAAHGTWRACGNREMQISRLIFCHHWRMWERGHLVWRRIRERGLMRAITAPFYSAIFVAGRVEAASMRFGTKEMGLGMPLTSGNSSCRLCW